MVGPGEVDQDLEPEVKDECNTKYGDVNRVVIYEVPNVDHEEAVRIFVEFKRIESAIKGKIKICLSVCDCYARNYYKSKSQKIVLFNYIYVF